MPAKLGGGGPCRAGGPGRSLPLRDGRGRPAPAWRPARGGLGKPGAPSGAPPGAPSGCLMRVNTRTEGGGRRDFEIRAGRAFWPGCRVTAGPVWRAPAVGGTPLRGRGLPGPGAACKGMSPGPLARPVRTHTHTYRHTHAHSHTPDAAARARRGLRSRLALTQKDALAAAAGSPLLASPRRWGGIGDFGRAEPCGPGAGLRWPCRCGIAGPCGNLGRRRSPRPLLPRETMEVLARRARPAPSSLRFTPAGPREKARFHGARFRSRRSRRGLSMASQSGPARRRRTQPRRRRAVVRRQIGFLIRYLSNARPGVRAPDSKNYSGPLVPFPVKLPPSPPPSPGPSLPF